DGLTGQARKKLKENAMNPGNSGDLLEGGDRRSKLRYEVLAIFLTKPEIGRTHPSPEALDRYNAALTHRSFVKDNPGEEISGEETDYERLEFLGDRVLNLIVAEHLFRDGRESEGSMTSRMEAVKNQHLGALVPALGIGFENLVRVGRNQVKNSRILAGAFEAFVGALYLDAGMMRTKSIVWEMIGGEIMSFDPDRNYKKILQEMIQQEDHTIPEYRLCRKEGLDHLPLFTFEVLVGGIVLGRGKGRSKAEATQEAAKDALSKLAQTRVNRNPGSFPRFKGNSE
ncbi:MAG: putative dsRNA-binding protein, partial [Methanolinea sp.]|nr:putative dsRNA-binding protein [Methanolinea sp.]